MPDRYRSLTVVLEEDFLLEDIEPLMNAILQFKNVISIAPEVAKPGEYAARVRAKRDLKKQILDLLSDG